MEIHLDNHKKHSLGHRAFVFFLSKRLRSVILFFLIAGGAYYAKQWIPAEYAPWADFGAQLILILAIAYLVFILFRTWLEYRYYTYMFTEEAFMMTSGYMLRTETAALYHQIQNVNIVRGPMDRIAGVSQIVIVMTGAGREPNKIVLPAVGKKKAKAVQQELLVRARRHVPPAQ